MTTTPYIKFTPAKASSAKKKIITLLWCAGCPHRLLCLVNLLFLINLQYVLCKNMQKNVFVPNPLQINNNNFYFRVPSLSIPPKKKTHFIFPQTATLAPTSPTISIVKKQKKIPYIFWLTIIAVFLLFILCLFFFKN